MVLPNTGEIPGIAVYHCFKKAAPVSGNRENLWHVSMNAGIKVSW